MSDACGAPSGRTSLAVVSWCVNSSTRPHPYHERQDGLSMICSGYRLAFSGSLLGSFALARAADEFEGQPVGHL